MAVFQFMYFSLSAAELGRLYGLELAKIIESEMEQLAAAVQRRPGWGSKCCLQMTRFAQSRMARNQQNQMIRGH